MPLVRTNDKKKRRQLNSMKIYIKTYGCQMNERDSDTAAAFLVEAGHGLVDNEADADVLIFNTCSVRQQAEVKAIGKLGILKKLKRVKPDIIIGAMGCMAQNRKEELFEKVPHLDFVLGTEMFHLLPETIDAIAAERRQHIHIGFDDAVLHKMGARLPVSKQSVSAFIAIMRGCSRFCSYCIVPYVRGREKSRPMDDIIKEARALAERGVKEIFLLGQNVAAYGFDNCAAPSDGDQSYFAELLAGLNAIKGVSRIRFTSPHPAYFNDALIDAMASLNKVCEYLHLPLQSGSNGILKAMNRPYTAARYLEIVNKLKAKIPGISFSTDVIVGFPGETEADFDATRAMMNEVGFDNAYIFKYSPRKGTKAAGMTDDVPTSVKEERNQILLADLSARSDASNKAMSGKLVEVLVEGVSKRNAARMSGRSSSNRVVIFDPVPGIGPGDVANVRIDRTSAVSLFGKIEA